MFDYTSTELQSIESNLEPMLARAKENAAEAEQMAMDATRLLTVTDDQLGDQKNLPFFKRVWGKLAKKDTTAVASVSTTDLLQMQKMGWQYINMLNERELMMASSMITVKNNLMSLAITSEETRDQITKMTDKIITRFGLLENRMSQVEVQGNIHSWLLTIDTYEYDKNYSPMIRMLKVGKDFTNLKSTDWSPKEIKFLQQAIKNVGLDWERQIKISEFVTELIDEIELHDFSAFKELVALHDHSSNQPISDEFMLENISAPSFKALYKISHQHTYSSEVIDALAEQMDISKADALKKVILNFVEKEGVNVDATIPLRDLAVELLTCGSLAQRLHSGESDAAITTVNIQYSDPKEEPTNSATLTADEQMYLEDVSEYLSDDGVIDDKERRLLERVRTKLGITEQRAKELEDSLQNQKEQLTDDEQQYLDDVIEYLSDDGVIDDKERRLLERERNKLGITEQRAKELENNHQNADQQDALTEEEQAYVNDVKEYLEDGGEIDEKERRLLNRERDRLGISEDRANELENILLPASTNISNSTSFIIEEDLTKIKYLNDNAIKAYLKKYESKFSKVQELANKGDKLAILLFALLLEEGVGCDANESLADEYYKKSADIGNSYSQNAIANTYTIQEKYSDAFNYYKKSADQGDPRGQHSIGCCYLDGNGCIEDKKKAFDYFIKSAEQGNSDAQDSLGDCYRFGYGITSSDEKAFECYKNSAAQGNMDGLHSLALCFDEGIGCSNNLDKAFDNFIKAAELGHADAQAYVSIFHSNGLGSCSKNEKEAFDWAQKSSDQGSILGQNLLGGYYFRGVGCSKSSRKAFHLYIKSAENDNEQAQDMVAWMYINGDGAKQSYTEGLRWYKMLAEQGNINGVAAYCFIQDNDDDNSNISDGTLQLSGVNLDLDSDEVRIALQSYGSKHGIKADDILVFKMDYDKLLSFSSSGKKGFIITNDMKFIGDSSNSIIDLLNDSHTKIGEALDSAASEYVDEISYMTEILAE